MDTCLISEKSLVSNAKGKKERKTYQLICVECGTEFTAKKINAQYCKKKCRPKKLYNHICQHCHVSFESTQSKQLYCKIQCSAEAQMTRPICICKNCGITFYPKNRENITFCKRECNYEYKKAADKFCKECNALIPKDATYCASCKKQKELIKAANEIITSAKIQVKETKKVKKAEEQQSLIAARKAERKKELDNQICQECSNIFSAKTTKKYCDKCRKIIRNKREALKEKRRYEKIIANGPVDWDIDVKTLAERDKDICHICNEKVDWKDKEYRDGTTIIGKKYPSTDHIIALDNGGTHTWDNVKLAHNQCNGIKSNKAYDDTKNQLQFYM